MKLLAVDHNALDPVHRSLYAEIARERDITLRLVVPERWYDNYHWLRPTEGELHPSYEIVSSPVLFPSRTHRMVYLSLREHVRAFQPDVLYMNAEPETFQAYQGVFISPPKGRMKFVFSSWRNIDYTMTGFPYKARFLNAYAERFVLQRADHCTAFHDAARDIFVKKGFLNVTVIPPAIDPHIFTQSRQSRQRQKGAVIGYVGRFIPEKGIDTLLRAVSRLSFDYRLELIGDGSMKRYWKSLARELGMEHKVIWTPPLLHQEVAKRLAEFDVVVLPSRTGKYWKEQFGRILIEAMACGVPVIGSNSGEIPNVIGDAGLVFPEGDVEALRSCLERLIKDLTLRTDLIRCGLERVRKVYDVHVVAQQHRDLFKNVAAG